MTVLTTARMRLEPLQDHHLEGLFELNRDPAVMRYITGKPDTREDSALMIERVKSRWIEFGYSWWAFMETASGQLIGTGCVQHLGRDAANPLELGWRLRQDRWGQGYASEAARAMAAFAFETIGTNLLCAVCHPENRASAKVMERLGMHEVGIERWYDMDCRRYDLARGDWKPVPNV